MRARGNPAPLFIPRREILGKPILSPGLKKRLSFPQVQVAWQSPAFFLSREFQIRLGFFNFRKQSCNIWATPFSLKFNYEGKIDWESTAGPGAGVS